VDGKCTETLL